MARKSRSQQRMHNSLQRPAPNAARSDLMSTRLFKGGTADIALLVFASLLWTLAAAAIATRTHFVLTYNTAPSLTPSLEFVGAPLESLITILIFVLIWIGLAFRSIHVDGHRVRKSAIVLSIAGLPALLVALRICAFPVLEPTIFEPLWLACGSGWSTRELLIASGSAKMTFWNSSGRLLGTWIIVSAALLTGGWWYSQSRDYYDNFLLGFNDFGHFTQRIASTAQGAGFLKESPVLPSFWDHFNPGILILVPLWKVFPIVEMIFFVQAFCLAIGAVLIRHLALVLNGSSRAATLWGLAWLAHPSLGQMNLAYTYGWHPVSLSMPALIASLLCLCQQRRWMAATCVVVACSMEENVIVITGMYAAARAVRRLFLQWRGTDESSRIDGGLTAIHWLLVNIICVAVFLLAYRYSGFAEFQSGRFLALGGTPLQIMLSPFLRPEEFWGQIFRTRTLVFISALVMPMIIGGIRRAYWLVLPLVVPLMVLIVWDHLPAQSLAFQYAANLLPLLWFAAIVGSRCRDVGIESPRENAVPNAEFSDEKMEYGYAAGALSACLCLSLFLGQFPWSSPTISDVVNASYVGSEELRRRADQPDGVWLTKLTEQIRLSREPVLATGRIASHLVGCAEVETVGQYLQRKSALLAITQNNQPVIGRYRTIVLDLRESFQQQPVETQSVLKEATDCGFEIEHQKFDILVLRSPLSKQTF